MARKETARIGRRKAKRKNVPYIPLHNPERTTENGHESNEGSKTKKR